MRIQDEVSGNLIILDNLADVTISSPIDGQVLTYDSVSQRFRNESPASGASASDLSVLQDTNVQLNVSQLSGILLTPSTFSMGWSGTLSVARGGTGVATFGGINTLLYTTGTNVLASLSTQPDSLLTTSSGGAPQWATGLPNAVMDGITRLGTVVSGVWNGTRLTYAFVPAMTAAGVVGATAAGDAGQLTFAQVGAQIALPTLSDVSDASLPTKGNVLVGNGTSWTVQGPGVDGQALVANSANPTGLGYSSVAGPAGPTGPAGPVGPSSAPTFLFDSGTTDADPGNGFVRFNSGTYASVTAIYIDDLSNAGVDFQSWYAIFDDSTTTGLRGQLLFAAKNDPSRFAIFAITGASTEATGYWKFAVAHVASAGPLSGETLMLFVRTGDKGTDGAGAGDVIGPASSVDNNIVAFNGTTGKSVRDSGKALPSGTIVGTTDTQTLSGKTITFAANTLTGVAPLASPTFTGTAAAPTPAAADNSTTIATTAFVQGLLTTLRGSATAAGDTLGELETLISARAPLASPTFTGTPAAPTAPADTNTTQIATTAYVQGEIADREVLGQVSAINTQTSAYTLLLSDKGKVVEMNVAGAHALTVPPNSTAAFPITSYVNVTQLGAGQTTITAGAGVTLRSPGAKLKLTGQYSSATLYKRGTDEWVVAGDLST